MDAHAWEEQNNIRKAENSYQLGLERAATGSSQLASMVGNQKANDAFYDGFTALARGGPAEDRRPYLVGEKGPELMVPDQSGTIIPNRKLQVLARALKKRTIARAKGGPVKAGGEPDPGGLDTVDKDWPAPLKAQVEREASLAAGATSLGSPESYGGGVRTPQRELRESELSTGQGRIMPIPSDGRPTHYIGDQTAPRGFSNPDFDLTSKDPYTGYDPSKPSFSNPVAVMRRSAQTYTGPEGGQEYRSLAEANQAFIRGQGGENAPGFVPGTIPGYDPPEGPKNRNLAELHAQSPEVLALADERKAIGEERLAKADALTLEQDTKTGTDNVSALGNYLKNAHGALVDNKVVFKPADEGMARDALASEQVAKTAGAAGASAAVNHFQERQAVRSYLKTPAFMKTVQNPNAFDANAYLGAASQNPAVWNELVARGRAMKVTAPTAQGSPWFGPTQLTGGVGEPLPAAPAAPPVIPTQPTGRLRSLVESMQ